MDDVRQLQISAPHNYAWEVLKLLLMLCVLPLVIILWLWLRFPLPFFFGRGGGTPKEMRTAHFVTVRRPDGRLAEARLERELMAATLRLGQDVSLWGSERGGVLYVSRGYNHTTEAEISLRSDAGYRLGMTLSVLGIAVFALFFAQLCVLPFVH